MSIEYDWRRKFIEVIEEVFRNLHFDPPAMTHDADASLVMELDVDGITFEVVHNPRANPAFCLIEAHVGSITSALTDQVLIHLLEKNLDFAKNYAGAFAADIKDDVILYNFPVSLAQLGGDKLLQLMRETGVDIRNWRMLLSDISSSETATHKPISAALV